MGPKIILFVQLCSARPIWLARQILVGQSGGQAPDSHTHRAADGGSIASRLLLRRAPGKPPARRREPARRLVGACRANYDVAAARSRSRSGPGRAARGERQAGWLADARTHAAATVGVGPAPAQRLCLCSWFYFCPWSWSWSWFWPASASRVSSRPPGSGSHARAHPAPAGRVLRAAPVRARAATCYARRAIVCALCARSELCIARTVRTVRPALCSIVSAQRRALCLRAFLCAIGKHVDDDRRRSSSSSARTDKTHPTGARRRRRQQQQQRPPRPGGGSGPARSPKQSPEWARGRVGQPAAASLAPLDRRVVPPAPLA